MTIQLDSSPYIHETGSFWLFPVPWAFRNLLNFIHDEFDSAKYPILVTENGLSSKDMPGIPTNGTDFEPVLDDQFRVTFYNGKIQFNKHKPNHQSRIYWSNATRNQRRWCHRSSLHSLVINGQF